MSQRPQWTEESQLAYLVFWTLHAHFIGERELHAIYEVTFVEQMSYHCVMNTQGGEGEKPLSEVDTNTFSCSLVRSTDDCRSSDLCSGGRRLCRCSFWGSHRICPRLCSNRDCQRRFLEERVSERLIPSGVRAE